MQRKRYLALVALMASAAVFLIAATASAQGTKARMKNRLPEIVRLKADGIIGETRNGFLAFVGSQKISTDLVEAENRDRRQVYEAIAKQQGTTPDLVGRRRALQIAGKAKPRDWLQDETGKWYRK